MSLIGLIVIALVIVLIFYVVGQMSLPPQTALIVRVILGIILILWLLQAVTGWSGFSSRIY